MEKIHVLLLDPVKRSARVVPIAPTVDAIRELVGGGLRTLQINQKDFAMWSDDSQDGDIGVSISGEGTQKLARLRSTGPVVILSTRNEYGEYVAPKTPLGPLMQQIEFAPEEDEWEPPFVAEDILHGMVSGAFHAMTRQDSESYAGAAPGSLISYEFHELWTVIVSPGQRELGEEVLSIHAYLYGMNGELVTAASLETRGWERI